MISPRKLLLVITAVLLFTMTGIVVAYAFRKDIARHFAVAYLKKKNVNVHFVMSEFTWNRLVVTDIQVEKKTKASRVEVHFNFLFLGADPLRRIDATLERVDLSEVLSVQSKLSDSTAPVTGFNPNSFCRILLPLEVDLRIHTVSSKEAVYEVDTTIHHTSGDAALHLAIKTGNIPLIPSREDLFKIDILADARCGEGILDVKLDRFSVQSDEIHFTNFIAHKIKLELPPQTLLFHAKEIKSSIHAQITAKTMAFFERKWILTNPVITSDISLEPGGLRFSKLSVSEARNKITARNVRANYDSEDSFRISVPHSSLLSFKLTNELLALLPKKEYGMNRIAGNLAVSGSATYSAGKITGPITLTTRDGFLDTNYGRFEKVSIDYQLDSLIPLLPSSSLQSITSKVTIWDESHYEIATSFHTKDHSHFLFDSFHMKEQKAEINTDQAFSLDLDPLTLRDFHIVLHNVPLERLLQFALKETITAEGAVAGDLGLEYIDQKPKIYGTLSQTSPGRIRYRLTGSVPSKTLKFTDGPMDILNGYLYDFVYSELSVKITTDEKYQMIVRLSTTGRNPDYLGHKPLKLNLNVEQNLLSALKSLMLSYNLPEQLKERLENSENP